MGWYGRDNITKYYNIGFSEEELQEITAAYNANNREYKNPYFRKRANFIRFLALHCIDLEKENRSLRSTLASINREAPAAAMGQGGASEETTWTGYFRGVERNGNVLYLVWG
jgi:hypothetical protein